MGDTYAGIAPTASSTAQLTATVKAHVKAHPKRYAVLGVVIVIVIIIIACTIAYYVGKDGEGFSNNLKNGSNNPLWWFGSGDAGWGGSTHRTRQADQSRPYGASAEGGHDLAAAPGRQASCGGVDAAAQNEAQGLSATQSISGYSAQGMGDDSLSRLMHGSE